MMKRLALESPALRVEFDPATVTIVALHNKLTGETYAVSGDRFAIQIDDQVCRQADLPVSELHADDCAVRVRYDHVIVEYTLGGAGHFLEKRVSFTGKKAGALRRVVLSEPRFAAEDLRLVCYRHPNFERIEAQHAGATRREPGTEPVKTYFGRTPRGGFFTGVEMPFDASHLDGNQVHLSFVPSLKFQPGQTLACDAVFFGVYARHRLDESADEWRPHDVPAQAVTPLPSESQAMTAMVRSSFGPPRFGFVPMACGWHCQMEQSTYTPESVEGDLRSLDFLASCGVDWVSDSHPWAGETAKMNALTANDRYEPGELPRRFLDHAKRLGIKVVQWPSMNHTHPWSGLIAGTPGQPFRPDRPDWERIQTVPAESRACVGDFHASRGNCFANRPFREWITSVMFQALDTGRYGAWCMDGDFWGWGGYFHSTVPVECASDQHDHLAGDANFACQRALDELIAEVHRRYPQLFIGLCRPPMDLGVWSNRHADGCFTLIETGSGNSNIAAGDEIRLCSRIRVHHHFFPHTLDWPLLFPSYWQADKTPLWPSAKLDYILLSAMSCAPNLLMYFPTKTGIPEADKAEIRRWLDWGRKNEKYLLVRHDLPDWPAPGRVDGSAHVVGDRGLIFLFNPNKQAMRAKFVVNTECLGVEERKRFVLSQSHPRPKETKACAWNETVEWEIEPETAVVLELTSAD